MTKRMAGLAVVVGLIAALAFAAVQAALPDSAVGFANVSLSADDRGDDSGDDPGEQGRADKAHGDQEHGDQGHGPPAWANNDHDKAKSGNDAWKQLTPGARSDLMTRLVKQHRQGMKEFAACQEAGGEACEKPLPPGLAKKL